MKQPHSWRSCIPIALAPALLYLASLPLPGAMVGNWIADDYSGTGDWTSTAATGSIVATVNGEPFLVDGAEPDSSFNGHDAIDLGAVSHFVVPAASSPVTGLQQFTMVAVFKPVGVGFGGGSWWEASGLIGMEQNGSRPDWGFGWSNGRIAAGVGGPDVTMFSRAQSPGNVTIAMFTWSGGVQKIFRNGVLANSDSNVATAPRVAGAFALGAMKGDPDGSINQFDGQIAELQIYNTDESANAASIFTTLKNKYVGGVMMDYAKLSSTGGTFILNDTTGATVNAGGNFDLTLTNLADSSTIPVPDGSLTVTKSGTQTTVKFTAPVVPTVIFSYNLAVPLQTGGPQTFEADFLPFKMGPTSPMASPPGAVGSWGIREYSGTPNPANIAGVTALATAGTGSFVEDAASPVLNHADPTTNGGTGSQGYFNNDFNILTDTAADDNWTVVARTKITVTGESTRTFGVHSDDGFALRITGGAGGSFVTAGGGGQLDPGDDETIFFDGGTGDSNTFGVYHFNGAGTYDVFYIGWDGGSGGYHEVFSAEGTFKSTLHTNTWALVGTPADPEVPALRVRWPGTLPGPAGTAGKFGVRTYRNAGDMANITNAINFLTTTARQPSDPDGLTVDAQLDYLNRRDPQDGGPGGMIPGDQPFPGDTGDNDQNVATVAKGRISITSAGPYTFAYSGDDGYVLRIKGVDGNPNPGWRMASDAAIFMASSPNELYFDGGGTFNGRGVVDLAAGEYDIEFVQYEGGGSFYYELTAAPGVWVRANPPGGFQLVGYVAPVSSVLLPAIDSAGWSVLTGEPNTDVFADNINGAEARIAATAGAPTIWDSLNFDDPQAGGGGDFAPNNPFPKNTPADDNHYAMKATGILNITQAGDYNLGFQGDDGGYMFIYGHNGTEDPTISGIFFTNLGGNAVLGDATGSAAGTNNAVRANVGTGNSRTIVTVPLEVGQYRIVTLVFEGGGGSWWEVIGAKAGFDETFIIPLLARNGPASVPLTSGLPVVAQPVVITGDLKVTNVVFSGNPVTTISFNIVSQEGVTYTVQGSVDLETWIDLDDDVPATGGSTPVTVILANYPQLDGESKVFIRVKTND